MLTISDTSASSEPRIRVSIHTRTHPNEVQSTYATNEIIDLLIGETPNADILRKKCIFNIVPMYNPDGVELGIPRQNANNVDLERNWDPAIPAKDIQPEKEALNNQFNQFMASESPIRIALNMHSAFACKRYFVYHDQAGTSESFAEDEKFFIGSIRNYYLAGIQPWDYFVSWTSGTPPYYPESWFWNNYQETVMALTYEDMNCESAGNYDKTAKAILNGIIDYLGLSATYLFALDSNIPENFSLYQNYPNPFNGETIISYSIKQQSPVKIILYENNGRLIQTLMDETKPAGSYNLKVNSENLASGIYYYQMTAGNFSETKRMLIVK